MTITRRRKLRTYRELMISLAGHNVRFEIDGHEVTAGMLVSYEDAGLKEIMEQGRLWAVTYHRLGSAEEPTGGQNG